MFETKQREVEDITVLDLHGRLVLGEPSSILRTQLSDLINTGIRKILLNLEDVEYIDSTGLGTLVMAATSLKKSEGKLVLLNLNRRNIELMVMTKLSTVFEIFNDETDAINSFFPERKVHKFDILNFVQQQKD